MDVTSVNWGDGDTLSVRSYLHGDALIIEAQGVVVATTLSLLATALREAKDTALFITVDLRRVDFLDSRGLALLVQESKRLRSAAAPLAPRVVVTVGGQPERILRLGAFHRILEIVHNLDEEG